MRRRAPTRARVRTRATPGKMNKSEEKYAREVLEPARLAGELQRWAFEDHTLVLTDPAEPERRVRLTPDFRVINAAGEIEFHDVKAAWRDKRTGTFAPRPEEDASVKLAVAAARFPEYRFIAVGRVPDKHGGGWVRKEYSVE